MGDRPTWSEIDKRKDGRSGGTKSAPRTPREPNRYQQKKLNDRFDSLFTDPKRDEALARVRSKVGQDTFPAAVDQYRAEYGIPEDYDLLMSILEQHTDTELRVEALERMDGMVDEQAESTQQVFKSRVKLLRMTERVVEVKKLASKISRRRNL